MAQRSKSMVGRLAVQARSSLKINALAFVFLGELAYIYPVLKVIMRRVVLSMASNNHRLWRKCD